MKKIVALLDVLCVAAFLVASGCRKSEKLPDPLSDIDGNIYKTVKIGTQEWMAENLKTTRYNDGTDIPLIKDEEAWEHLISAGYCIYGNDDSFFKDTYGALYNGYVIETGKLCPAGWHVPERQEWILLRDFLGDSLKAGGKLKEAGLEHWITPNKGADNSSGFTALGAGLRYFEGTFSSLLSFTCIWSSTIASTGEKWYAGLYFADPVFIIDHRNKKNGASVRCLKDKIIP